VDRVARGSGNQQIDGVDLAALAGWMDRRGIGEGPIEDVTRLGGGTQNILVRFRRGDRDLVLRRPPRHKRRNSDETMVREARILDALAGSDVPHPGFVAGEASTDALGAAFYLMEPVDGRNLTEQVDEPHRSDRTVQHDIGLAMVDAIAALGAIDPTAVGLSDLGRSEGWLERQPERWARQHRGYLETDGYEPDELPLVPELGMWLEEHLPTSWRAGLMHGDFHLANVLVSPTSGALAAVVDWELATIGDPLVDLGHLLVTWPSNRLEGAVAPAAPLPGLATPDELVARYAERSGRDLSTMTWYRVFAAFRLAILVEGTHVRALAGAADPAVGDDLHRLAVRLLDEAEASIDGEGTPGSAGAGT
jgi:aminoglycoside phosphotransferase (APT) family kinase protein